MELQSLRVLGVSPLTAVSHLSTRGMFAGCLREAQQKEVLIHGVSYTAMKKILDYFYTSEMDLDLECVQEVLIGATLMQVGFLSWRSSVSSFLSSFVCHRPHQ